MTDRTNKISQSTLIPLAFVILIIGVVWGLATDRAQAVAEIVRSEKRISLIEEKLDTVSASLLRIEQKLGTMPGK